MSPSPPDDSRHPSAHKPKKKKPGLALASSADESALDDRVHEVLVSAFELQDRIFDLMGEPPTGELARLKPQLYGVAAAITVLEAAMPLKLSSFIDMGFDE